MDINSVGKQLSQMITSGMVKHFANIHSDLQQDGLYAYSLYCASGFCAFGIAASTHKSLIALKRRIRQSEAELLETLEQHPDLAAHYLQVSDLQIEMSAPDWDYLYSDIDAFNPLDDLVSQIRDYGLQTHDEEFDVSAFISEHLVFGIKAFQTKCATGELLTGLQFTDPSTEEVEITENISRQVNNDKWHRKVLALNTE
ncbi:hypothetical protein L2750_00525 [Shewanella submarina]|uniref:DUF4303 domain-containing protein n=1 Tax=Shewanella submarina TaxID=2016376 RepID=A0ABV7GI72_9GAMM|nr:hypothetical protein [Shewanella submarina]MCL1035643.1 hypothetical protein [Shewanella submarina]